MAPRRRTEKRLLFVKRLIDADDTIPLDQIQDACSRCGDSVGFHTLRRQIQGYLHLYRVENRWIHKTHFPRARTTRPKENSSRPPAFPGSFLPTWVPILGPTPFPTCHGAAPATRVPVQGTGPRDTTSG